MDNLVKNNNKKNMRWIVALCLTATLAIVGWSVTGTLATRMKTFEAIQNDYASLHAVVTANNVRLSVLENKYDNIQVSLTEIKLILQKLRDDR